MISESLIYEGGHTKLVLCDNLEGQGAESGVPLYIICHFSLVAFNILSLSLIFVN